MFIDVVEENWYNLRDFAVGVKVERAECFELEFIDVAARERWFAHDAFDKMSWEENIFEGGCRKCFAEVAVVEADIVVVIDFFGVVASAVERGALRNY